MKKILVAASLAEGATGLALILVPSFVGQALLGAPLSGVAIPVGRVAGIALVGLAIACWPGRALVGMWIYGTAVALYLALLGVAGGFAGPLLWPAVVVHAALSGLLGRIWLKSRSM